MRVDPRGNSILRALPDDELGRLLAQMHRVRLVQDDVIHEQDAPVTEVYFPTSGAVSVLIVMADGSTMEPAIIGSEGMLGFPIGHGDDLSRWRSLVRIDGEAMVVSLEALREHILAGGQMNAVLMHYAGLLISLVAQSAACSQFHHLRERCARWILLMHDRAARDDLPLTQEQLASMVGAHRPSVSLALQELRDAGAIELSRGTIRVLGRARLEADACECYERIQVRYDERVDPGATEHRLSEPRERRTGP